MSRGSKIVPIRFMPLELQAMDNTIARLNDRRKGTPLNRTDFIREALREKYAHLERSRKPRRRSPAIGE